MEAATSAADVKKADKLERLAKTAYKKGNFQDAVAAFEAAYETVARPRYLFNLARCHERLGDLTKAVEYVESYLEVAKGEDRADGEAVLEVLKVKIDKEMGGVVVTTVPGGAPVVLTKDGERRAGVSPFEGRLWPGRWEVKAKKRGVGSAEGAVRVVAGETAELELVLTPEAGAGARADGDGGRWLPWAVLGAGAAVTAAGVVMALRSRDALDRREAREEGVTSFKEYRDADDEARSAATAANVLFGVGGAALLAGGVIWVW